MRCCSLAMQFDHSLTISGCANDLTLVIRSWRSCCALLWCNEFSCKTRSCSREKSEVLAMGTPYSRSLLRKAELERLVASLDR